LIPFNKLYLDGNEIQYINESVKSGKISGDGIFTEKCHNYFEKKYFDKVLLTTSCTDAIEMSALLIDISKGDEVIAPSFTFVSTVNPFVLRGAKIIFADSEAKTPNIDADKVEELITDRTKAIVVVHYAGVACDMDKINEVANKYNLYVIEDAAQAIDSYYKSIPLGSLGTFGTLSFHETKNIISGEGGLLIINDKKFVSRAEIVREKGTNRSSFFRGEVDKYGWVDVGSSFLPSDITAAILYAQLERLQDIQNKRKKIWNQYYNLLLPLAEKGFFRLQHIPSYATNNAHMFFIECRNITIRDALISFLHERNVQAVFHYQALHKSPYYKDKYMGKSLPNAEKYSDRLLRLPMYNELTEREVSLIVEKLESFFIA
jgi:dTDP-4-amino-4,6-dideoxygalactose transaminase